MHDVACRRGSSIDYIQSAVVSHFVEREFVVVRKSLVYKSLSTGSRVQDRFGFLPSLHCLPSESMVRAGDLGWSPGRKVVGLSFSCVSCSDFCGRLFFFFLVVPWGRGAGVRFVVWGVAPIAESICDAVGLACLSFFRGSWFASGSHVFGLPRDCVQIHGISSVCGCRGLGVRNGGAVPMGVLPLLDLFL